MIAFVLLNSTHFPLLLKWLETSHVKAWWDQDIVWTPELIQGKYGTYVEGYKVEKGIKKPMHAYIICVDHQEIGYIQYYNAYDYPRDSPLEGLPESLAALDLFIGDENYTGKGLGSKVMQQFLQGYVAPHFDYCCVNPDSTNYQAIKAYEKAGFRKIREHQEAKAVWMLWEQSVK